MKIIALLVCLFALRVSAQITQLTADGLAGLVSTSTLNPGPVPQVWWKMNEGSGTITYDSSTNAFTGNFDTIQMGSPYWTNWPGGGNAIFFNGVDAYIQCGQHSIIAAPPFTYTIWVIPNKSNAILTMFSNGGNAAQFRIGSTLDLELIGPRNGSTGQFVKRGSGNQCNQLLRP